MRVQISISLLLFTLLSLGACRYKDGPKFTVRSAKARMSNTWKVHKYTYDDADQTTTFKSLSPNWELTMNKDYTYVWKYTALFLKIEENGTWEFLEGGTKFNLRKDGTGSNIWTITRLKENEIWAEQLDNNSKLIQYQLRP
jgi:hypothetical protein